MNKLTRHKKIKSRKSRKSKYGGTLPNFNVYELPSTNLYHGTFNTIITDLITPYFLSMDPLQSVGHLLIEFKSLFREQSKQRPNASTITNKLELMRSCFPTLYVYNSPAPLRLLQINNPSNSGNSFDILFNKPLLLQHVQSLPNADEIMNLFINKIDALGVFKIPPNSDINIKFKQYLDKWSGYCEASCFAGWANTPGYLLLSKINYNKYFKELKLIEGDVTGIYVHNDQDEIIMFEPLNKVNKIPVFPYDVLNASSDAQLEFIVKYKTLPLPEFMNHCVKPYIYFMGVDNIRNTWDFGFFKTKCVTYNPYKPIAKQLMLNKTQNCKSTCRISTTPSDNDTRYFDPSNLPCYDHALDDTEDETVIPSDYTSVKYSIKREDHLYYLSMYIQKIITSTYLSVIIDALDNCSNASVLDRRLNTF